MFSANFLLGVGFKYLLKFPPYLGKWSTLTNMIQMGWNHQLVYEFVGGSFWWIHPL